MNVMVAHGMFRRPPTTSSLIALPLFHSFGQNVQMNNAFMAGATIVLQPRFDPDAAFKAMQTHKVTIFCGVPTMYIALLNLASAAESTTSRRSLPPAPRARRAARRCRSK